MARAAANGEWQIGVVEHDDSSLLVRQGENRRGYICTLLPAARALGPSRLCAARCGDSTRCAKLTGSAAAAAHAPSSAVMLGALLLFVGVCASPRCVVFPRSQARGAVFTAPRPVFLCARGPVLRMHAKRGVCLTPRRGLQVVMLLCSAFMVTGIIDAGALRRPALYDLVFG